MGWQRWLVLTGLPTLDPPREMKVKGGEYSGNCTFGGKMLQK
jgi:hypothetical protein